MKITQESLKFPQIEAAFKQIYDNNLYRSGGYVLEFGTGAGNSLIKICKYLRDNYWHDINVLSFDCFEGLPQESNNVKVFEKYQPGTYKFDHNSVKEHVKKGVGGWPYGVNYCIFKLYFDQLNEHICPYLIKDVMLVHIDCDIYKSTYQALDWLFSNKLISVGTLFAFDEYVSTNSQLDGGESKAFWEIRNKYKFHVTLVWSNLYIDKDTGKEITQAVFRIDKFWSGW